MFTLVNTWTGYHRGKPRVLREAVLVIQLRLLFHFPEGKHDAASPLNWVQAPLWGAGISPAGRYSQLVSSVADPWATPSRQTPQQVIMFQPSKLLKFLDAALLSISCQKETCLHDKLKHSRPWKPSFYLLSILFSLPKSAEKILCQSTPLHL